MKKIIIILGIIAVFMTACGGDNITGSVVKEAGEYDEFAQCITDEGVKMYGAYWCPNCAQQKDLFGNSFQYVSYIECSLPNRQGTTRACQMANIQAYPTWEFGDGSRTRGVMELASLANKTGCEL